MPIITTFGGTDAESDDLLAEYFIETDAYGRIENQQRFIVIGRKGSGKSAIYRTIESRARHEWNNVHVAPLEFSQYPWQEHGDVPDPAVSRVERYAASWRFLILVETVKLVLESGRHALPPTDEAQRAERDLTRFLTRNWGATRFSVKELFTRRKYSYELSPNVLSTSIGSVKVEDLPRESLGQHFVAINEWLQRCLEALLDPDGWYFLLLDDLDRAYMSGDEEYSSKIIGLLLAARGVRGWGLRHGFDVAPVVFLRDDIYDSLSFADKNKLTQSNVERLSWTGDEAGPHSLKALLEQRIRVLGAVDIEDPWSVVFDARPTRGRQSKYRHMVDRTYLRPRDLIAFGNACLEQAVERGEERVSNESIAAARDTHSQYLLGELDDEIHQAWPEWQAALDILRRIGVMRFSRDDFDQEAQHGRALDRPADRALELLFQFGVVGYLRRGGAGRGGSETVFAYLRRWATFDQTATYLRVHPGLKESLELAEAPRPAG